MAKSYRFTPDKFPIRIEMLHWKTRAVVWTKVIVEPDHDGDMKIEIPALARVLGHPVAIRMTFGDGDVIEKEPAAHQEPR
jgi:hypothetical protein